jgi:hypothetical protein
VNFEMSTEIERMENDKLLEYFAKLCESRVKKEQHERRDAFEEIKTRMSMTRYKQGESQIFEGIARNVGALTEKWGVFEGSVDWLQEIIPKFNGKKVRITIEEIE